MSRNRALLPHGGLVPRALTIVPYLTAEEVARLARACQGRHRVRDELLILTLFQTGLRVSEALSLTPRKIESHQGPGRAPTSRVKGRSPAWWPVRTP